MATCILLKYFSCFCLVWFGSIVAAIPVLESAPGIEIIPAAFSEGDTPQYVVVELNKGTNTNNLQQAVMNVPEVQQPQPVTQAPPVVQYQQPATQQQPQYQYAQPQPVYQQSPYYRPQPQVVQYPAPPGSPYYSAPASSFSPYGSPQPGPYYPGPIGERGGFLSGLSGPGSGSRYSPFGGSLPSGLSTGASLLGAALLLG
ncbi:E1A-binding protein p400-like [Anopheles stephensi]|uniref:E1A-binding protein p400-like n=1 Tax=Anopheles stephensi TaxID=30069 RepID=UPI001658A611|nr:E1A-binding protein p400-like [Anopheles stephensi]